MHAPWLNDEEKGAVCVRLDCEGAAAYRKFGRVVFDPCVYALGLAGAGLLSCQHRIQRWVPQIAQDMGLSNPATGFVVAMPYVAAVGAMIFWGRSREQNAERIWPIVSPMLVAATALILGSITHSVLMLLIALFCAVISIEAMMGPAFIVLGWHCGSRRHRAHGRHR
jgi:MFS transporter, ACS family, tartrate transporter